MWWFLLGIVLVSLTVFDSIKPADYPPGPRWIPWFGTTFVVQKLSKKLGGLHEVFKYLSQKHQSPVVGLRFGKELTVGIRGYDLAKEALTGDDLLGRPDNFFIRLRTDGERLGLTFTDGKLWEEHRSFIMRTLKEVGYGRSRMEELIQKEAIELKQTYSQRINSTSSTLPTAVAKCIERQRIERDDNRLQMLLKLLRKRSGQFDLAGGLLNQMPWLRFLAPNWSGYNLVVDFNRQLMEFFAETIRNHYETYTDTKSSNDLIYAYIREFRNQGHNPGTTFTEKQMLMTILDLFLAGGLNTSTVTDLLLLMMVVRPDIQAKVHQEIDNHLNPIRWSDRSQLPFVEAVIMEVQRFFPTAAFGGPRRAVHDFNIGGYRIPKNTTVFVDLESVHHDEAYWKDPEVFRPERFLDEGGHLVTCDRLLPFSLGKRKCPGDGLAKTTIFLFFVELLRNFELSLPEGAEVPSTELVPGRIYMPKPYWIIFSRRS
ncbi:cytochrome P450 2L1 [Culex quinquefasciatus]|uniref:Cytochrome P450 2L1 n=1 Tax=Culex quinquefasciatus TaxID=7176 RepID=B0X5V3_CULQU|nr:cytochrome P450 2L1 [Culex quinquefasciatus]|eukprot:XP_001865025.1 cytochrome P450 2L1 [Culex quinquefasciatus]